MTRAPTRLQAHTDVALLEHANMRMRPGEMSVRLRSGSSNAKCGRDGRRGRHCIDIERTVAVLERFEGDKFGQLATEDFRVTSKMMCHDLRSLLVFREVSALIEATRS